MPTFKRRVEIAKSEIALVRHFARSGSGIAHDAYQIESELAYRRAAGWRVIAPNRLGCTLLAVWWHLCWQIDLLAFVLTGRPSHFAEVW